MPAPLPSDHDRPWRGSSRITGTGFLVHKEETHSGPLLFHARQGSPGARKFPAGSADSLLRAVRPRAADAYSLGSLT